MCTDSKECERLRKRVRELEAEVAYLRASREIAGPDYTVEQETEALAERDRLYDKWQRLLGKEAGRE